MAGTREERSYTPQDVTRALEAVVRLGSFAAAAQEQQLPVKTVEHWAKHPGNGTQLAEIRLEHARVQELFRAGLCARAWEAVGGAIDTLVSIRDTGDKENDRVSAARGLADIATRLDTARRLDTGTPTSISADVSDPAALIREAEEWLRSPETAKLLARGAPMP